jgi:hypothetical protein
MRRISTSITALAVSVALALPAFAQSRTAPEAGGGKKYRNIDCGTTGAVIKAGPGQLHWYYISNSGAAKAYVKFYDKATAGTTSDTPVFTIEVPAASAANASAVIGFDGAQFDTGIGIRCSTAIADNDATAPATNQIVVNATYR